MRTAYQTKIKLDNFETSPELAEVKVVYKSKQRNNKVKIGTSQEAFDVLFSLYDKDTIGYFEQFYLLLLNRANAVLGWIKLSSGGTSGTVVDMKMIFALALLTNSHGILICHNHPSGNISPSNADIVLSKSIKQAGKLLTIELIDHLIINADGCYHSLSDNGDLL